jgi:hypothetical protein
MEYGSKIYLGNTEIIKSYIGSQQVDLYPQKGAGTATQYAVRTDPYAANLKLAMPYQLATNLGMNNFYDDISAVIKGSGTNYKLVPSGSGTFNNSGTPVNSGSYNFASDGYATSMLLGGTLNVASQNAGVVTDTFTAFGTQNFVIETWVNIIDNNVLYQTHIFGNQSGDQILCDYATATLKNRFYINGSGGAASGQNIAQSGVWYHYAYVRSGSTNSIYFAGTRVFQFTNGSSIAASPVGYWDILGINIPAYAAVPAYFNDFRLYVGTDKGYVGSTITPPASMIYAI